MKKNLKRLSQLSKSIFFLWLLLIIFKLFGLNLRINSNQIFNIFLISLFVLLFIETLLNRETIIFLFLSLLKKVSLITINRRTVIKNVILSKLFGSDQKVINNIYLNIFVEIISFCFLLIYYLNKVVFRKINIVIIFILLMYYVNKNNLDLLEYEIFFNLTMLVLFIYILVNKTNPVIFVIISGVLLFISGFIKIRYNDEILCEKLSVWVFVFLFFSMFSGFVEIIKRKKLIKRKTVD